MATEMIKKKGDGVLILRRKGNPSDVWFSQFLKRHPKLKQCMRKPKAVSVESLDKWFVDLQEYVKEQDCLTVLLSAERMWSVGEAIFPLGEEGNFVMAMERAGKSTGCPSSNNGQITMLQAMSAAGSFCPPTVGFPEDNLSRTAESYLEVPDTWFSFRSEHGTVTPDVFLQWLERHFHPFLQNGETEFPVLLLVDGHTSYIDDAVGNFCRANRIVLFKFPRNSSHILQPLDLVTFKMLEETYKDAEKNWVQENPGLRVTRDVFPHVLSCAWENTVGKDLAVSGFATAGLFPFDWSYNKESLPPSAATARSTQNPVPALWEEETLKIKMEQDASELYTGVEEDSVPSLREEETLTINMEQDASELYTAVPREPVQPFQPAETTVGPSRKRARGTSNWKVVTVTQVVEENDVELSTTVVNPSKPDQPAESTAERIEGRKSISMTSLSKRQSVKKKDKDVNEAEKRLRQAQCAVMHLMKDVREARRVFRESLAKELLAQEQLTRAEVAVHNATAEVKGARRKLKELKTAQRAMQMDVRKARQNLQQLDVAKSQRDEMETTGTSDASDASDAEETACGKCELAFQSDDEEEEWISCSTCTQSFHVLCTDIFHLPRERIAHVQYACPFCRYK